MTPNIMFGMLRQQKNNMDEKEKVKTMRDLEYSHYLLYLDEKFDRAAKSNICIFFLGFILKFYPDYELVWFNNISLDALGVKGDFKYGHR